MRLIPGWLSLHSMRCSRVAHSRCGAALAVALLASFASSLFAQQNVQPSAPPGAPVIDPSLYSAMRWRLIGPHRGGRVSAVAGIPGDSAVYYMGTPGGGVWKTTDGGSVWTPIFDRQRVASIGAVAIAPSNSNVIYVGTGEQTEGNGLYKSTDAGATWTHIGLDDTHYISSMIIDPRNPDVIIVGALGHPILGPAANQAARGVYKSTDGGKTWTRTLFKDEKAGVSDMVADPGNPRVLYAALWHPRDFFGDASEKQDSWIYKSVDQGSTWKPVGVAGLPAEPLDRIGLAVAPGDRGRRVLAISSRGLYRSDDAGDSWRKITADPRITGNGYICRVYVDPRNADTVYVMQTTTYRSLDGGQTFAAFKGAPGGDDYHVLWIDPQNSQRMILGVDQGATISLNGGKTWSEWFNQPTGQFYHVITDNQFPYVAYAPQQDSGTAAVPSRSDYGEITYRDWFSIGGFEFCYIAPDPTNPNIVYSGGWYGSVVRFDKITGQIAHVFVRGTAQRTSQMPPLVFSPQDPHTLYFGTQNVMKTTNSGDSWQLISPDLTIKPNPPAPAQPQGAELIAPQIETEQVRERARETPNAAGNKFDPDSFAYEMDDNDKDFEAEQNPRGGAALSVIAPSPAAAGVIWAGATNGVIQLTQDGGLSWRNVSPPEPSGFISTVEPSHFDANVAYATVNVQANLTPLAYRTRDAGKSWQKITDGFEPGWIVRVVREDPLRKGLLYAGTENAAYVSFDDGDHWQSLQLNLPTATIRDLAVHGNDLVAATYGRALWVLDDLSPLRQAAAETANASAELLRPSTAIRTRWDNDQETPLPPEFPGADNPPDGAIFYYYLKAPPADTIRLEIRDAQDNLVKRFTSEKPAPDAVVKNVPDYWFGALPQLPTNAGLNRFVWDLHYDPPPALQYSYFGNTLDYLEYTLSGHAVPGNTPREQTLGPLAVPGEYKVVLLAGGQKLSQPLNIELDPRVHVSRSDLVLQFEAAQKISAGLKSSYTTYNAAAPLRAAIEDRTKILTAAAKEKPEPPKSAKTISVPSATEGGKAAVTPSAGAAPDGHGAAPKDSEALAALKQLSAKFDAIINGTRTAPGIGPINRDLARIDFMIETGDAAPADAAQIAIHDSCASLTANIAQWQELNSKTLPAVNAILDKQRIAPLPAASATMADPPGVPLDACAP